MANAMAWAPQLPHHPLLLQVPSAHPFAKPCAQGPAQAHHLSGPAALAPRCSYPDAMPSSAPPFTPVTPPASPLLQHLPQQHTPDAPAGFGQPRGVSTGGAAPSGFQAIAPPLHLMHPQQQQYQANTSPMPPSMMPGPPPQLPGGMPFPPMPMQSPPLQPHVEQQQRSPQHGQQLQQRYSLSRGGDKNKGSRPVDAPTQEFIPMGQETPTTFQPSTELQSYTGQCPPQHQEQHQQHLLHRLPQQPQCDNSECAEPSSQEDRTSLPWAWPQQYHRHFDQQQQDQKQQEQQEQQQQQDQEQQDFRPQENSQQPPSHFDTTPWPSEAAPPSDAGMTAEAAAGSADNPPCCWSAPTPPFGKGPWQPAAALQNHLTPSPEPPLPPSPFQQHYQQQAFGSHGALCPQPPRSPLELPQQQDPWLQQRLSSSSSPLPPQRPPRTQPLPSQHQLQHLQQQHQQNGDVIPGLAGEMAGAGGSAAGTCAEGPGSGSGGGDVARQWRYYHILRWQAAANHILFYLVDEQFSAELAVVGTDLRFSGHFIYSTLPEGPAVGSPLRCTNRNRVMDWLAAQGAVEAADTSRLSIPPLRPHELELLESSDPLYSRPPDAVLDRQYVSWREEVSLLPDGRHLKQFWLMAAPGRPDCPDRLVVTAEDSHRRDRRYTYKALPEFGGFVFENGSCAKEWLDFIVGKLSRPAPRSVKITQTSRRKTPPTPSRRSPPFPRHPPSPLASPVSQPALQLRLPPDLLLHCNLQASSFGGAATARPSNGRSMSCSSSVGTAGAPATSSFTCEPFASIGVNNYSSGSGGGLCYPPPEAATSYLPSAHSQPQSAARALKAPNAAAHATAAVLPCNASLPQASKPQHSYPSPPLQQLLHSQQEQEQALLRSAPAGTAWAVQEAATATGTAAFLDPTSCSPWPPASPLLQGWATPTAAAAVAKGAMSAPCSPAPALGQALSVPQHPPLESGTPFPRVPTETTAEAVDEAMFDGDMLAIPSPADAAPLQNAAAGSDDAAAAAAATAATAAASSWFSFVKEGEAAAVFDDDCASCRGVFSPGTAEEEACGALQLLDEDGLFPLLLLGGGGSGGLLLLPEPEPDFDPYTAPDVRAAFQRSPELLNWVTGIPDGETAATFQYWALKLAAFAASLTASSSCASDVSKPAAEIAMARSTEAGGGHSELPSGMDIDPRDPTPPFTGDAAAAGQTDAPAEIIVTADDIAVHCNGNPCADASNEACNIAGAHPASMEYCRSAVSRSSTGGSITGGIADAAAAPAAAAPPPPEAEVLGILEALAACRLNLRLCLMIGEALARLRDCAHVAVAAAAQRVAAAWHGVAAEAMSTAAAAARIQEEQHHHPQPQAQQQRQKGTTTYAQPAPSLDATARMSCYNESLMLK